MRPSSRVRIPDAEKRVAFSAAPGVFAALRKTGSKIVQSHGVFDLIHPGHILHLEEARALGDVLVVTLTADEFVHKGPGRPYFNEKLRMRSLAALACVDYVVLSPHPGAVAAIECIRPNVYCKGKEYEDPDFDLTGALKIEREAVERMGGQLRFAGPIKYSSTRLLNLFFDHLSSPVREFCGSLAKQISQREFHDAIESFRTLKLLVVGDTIFDRYSYVTVQGLTSKNRIISGRFLEEETQCGGALAVFRHVREFVDDVRFVSLCGTEPWAQAELRTHVPPAADRIIRDSQFTTVVKQRFVEPVSERKELSKLFAVNYLDARAPSSEVQEQVLERLRDEISRVDAVLLLDFGHGMMQERVRDFVQETAPFLALNCQTNSNNHGFNLISRQYRRADAFTLDAQELVLSCGRRSPDFPAELETLRRQLQATVGWLTRGAAESIGLAEGKDPCFCPPLEYDVVDTIGAGDAFYSVAALAAVRRLPVALGTFLGQLAAAQAVKIVGNARPISKQKLVQGGISLLNL
ncbi:MAG: cytidyltransferase [Pedosphaera sp.]|nr:cytidyltransferase [Pedosphaera sp.]